MPKSKNRPPNHLPGDDAETRALIDWLLERNVPFVRCSRYHIKVHHLNFYVGKWTIFVDGEQAAEKERGINAFKERLLRLSCIKNGDGDFDLEPRA